MAIEPYAGLELETCFETVGARSIKVIGRGGLERFLTSSRSVQEKLVSIPVEDRIAVLNELGATLARDLKCGKFQELAVGLAASTGYSERLIEGELAFIPSILSSESLVKCLKSSLMGAPASLNGFTEINDSESIWHLPAGPSLIVSSGNSIIPTIFPTAISMVVGNVTLLKPSLSNYAGVVEIFRILDRLPKSSARDALRDGLAISYYSHDSPVLKFALGQARMGVINFWGGGSARTEIKKLVGENPYHPRFIINGPMTGMALIDTESASDQNAEGLALNMALYNQQLCSSPTIVVFEGNIDKAVDFAKKVAKSLDPIGSAMPMKSEDVDHYSLHGARKCIQIKGSKVISSADGSNPWTIVTSGGTSALDAMVERFPTMNFYGRKRFIEIVAVDTLEKGLDIIAALPGSKAFEGIDKVQTVGIALADGKMEQVTRRLALMGVYRSVPLRGMFMRSAIEPNDGMGVPASFTYISYVRKRDIFPSGQVESIFQA